MPSDPTADWKIWQRISGGLGGLTLLLMQKPGSWVSRTLAVDAQRAPYLSVVSAADMTGGRDHRMCRRKESRLYISELVWPVRSLLCPTLEVAFPTSMLGMTLNIVGECRSKGGDLRWCRSAELCITEGCRFMVGERGRGCLTRDGTNSSDHFPTVTAFFHRLRARSGRQVRPSTVLEAVGLHLNPNVPQ